MTPEEQKLLVMQKLARIPKRHFLIKAPESNDCIIRAPFVADPMITKRRLAAGLETVYCSLPCYTTLQQHEPGVTGTPGNSIAHHTYHDDVGADDRINHNNNDVVDVEAREVSEVRVAENAQALPSPPADADEEAALWERWQSLSRGR
jgi:hypothetical protein